MRAYGGHKSMFEWLPQSLSTSCFEAGVLTASGAQWLAGMISKPFYSLLPSLRILVTHCQRRV